MMKKLNRRGITYIVLFIAAIFAAGMLLSTCDQAALFANISWEVAPKVSRIPGFPTNIVIAKMGGDDYIFAAGKRTNIIHYYRNGSWDSMTAPGNILALASANDDLYVLTYSGNDATNATLHKYDYTTDQWESIGIGAASGFSLQSIYGAGTTLFAGGKKDNTYNIFYDDSGSLKAAGTNSPFGGSAELNGVAFDVGTYYYAAGNAGFFSGTLDGTIAVVDGSSGNATGIIYANGTIYGTTWNGALLKLNGGNFESFASAPGLTGGMSIWNSDGAPGWTAGSLLLLGVQSGSRFDKGYREITLDAGSNMIPPGRASPSSISENSKNQYDNSIAKSSIYSIIAVPNTVETPGSNGPVIFAATVNGLFSCRNNVWNAE